MIIYKTTNLINFKFYIGQDRKNNPKYYGSGNLLKLAINKYDKENFRKDILEYCNSLEELNEREKFWIKLTRAKELGYNIANGGNNTFHCENLGEKHPNYGKHHSEETKRKISISNKNKFVSEETKRKISKNHIDCNGKNNSFYGKHHSKKSMKNMVKTRRKNDSYTMSNEQKEKIRKANKNSIWIYNEKLNKTKMIKNTEKIPEGWKQGRKTINNENHPRARKVIINGITYNTIKEASNKLNKSRSYIKYHDEITCIANNKNLYYNVSVEVTNYKPILFKDIKKYYE